MAIKVFADAASNLFNAILKAKKCDIRIVSLTLDVSGQQFKCYDDDIDVEEYSRDFYQKLREGASVKTSLANPAIWASAFEEEIKQGNEIICFTMASGISGTYNSACMAAEMINDECGKTVVRVIDSKTAGLGEGLQALHACKLIEQGKSFDEVCKACEDYVLKVRSEFTVGDIKYLAKTGRVSKLVAKIATVLNIKPILKGSKDATIVMAKKVRGRALALKTLAEDCVAHIKNPDEQIVYISHCDDADGASTLKTLLEKLGIKHIETYYYDLITGAHVGPGTIALFYVGENRD